MRSARRSCFTPAAFGLLAIVSLAANSGCAPSTGQVERGIERELPRVVGPAQEYDVEIEGLRARAGEARRVTAVGKRVSPPNAPCWSAWTWSFRTSSTTAGRSGSSASGAPS